MTDAELQSVIMNFGRRQPITTNSTSATMSHALAILSLSVLLALIMPGQIVASDHRIPMKIAAVGDSITYGACSTDPERYSYWARLQKWMGPSFAFRYFAKGGMTVCSKGQVAMQHQGTLRQDLLEWKPDVAILQFGTNDSKLDQWQGRCKSLFLTDYTKLIKTLQSQNTTVLIMIPPPVYPPFKYNVNQKVVNEQLPHILEHLSEVNGLAAPIDNFNLLGGSGLSFPELFCDGVHPLNQGYRMIAKQVYAALRDIPSVAEVAAKGPTVVDTTQAKPQIASN